MWHDRYHLKLALSIASFAGQHFSLGQAVTGYPLDRRPLGHLRNSYDKVLSGKMITKKFQSNFFEQSFFSSKTLGELSGQRHKGEG